MPQFLPSCFSLVLAASLSLATFSTSLAQTTADYIVAVVNSEPITHTEVTWRTAQVMQNLRQAAQPLPPSPELLEPEVLEHLIEEKIQLQRARDIGIQVDDFALEQTFSSAAVSSQEMRRQLRAQLVMQRLREREVDGRVQVSDLDIQQYLAEQAQRSAQGNVAAQALNLGHILISVPEDASPALVQERSARALQALDELRSGQSLQTVAQRYSDASGDAQMGMRPVQRYPEAFAAAVLHAAVGEVVGPVRTAAGFHLLVVLQKSSSGAPEVVVQQRARHILLRPSQQLTEAEAAQRLGEFAQRIERGTDSFASLARQWSQDGSAELGGDLGWANPGQFVPEFEQVLDGLEVGQISEPVVSRFGVHLIELLERREVLLDPRQQRDLLRQRVRQEKAQKTYRTWLQELRSQAYIEYRTQHEQ